MIDTFTVSRVFDAPRDLVYDVWTRPEHFAVWFGTEELVVPLDTLVYDVRPGGQLRATMLLPDGGGQIDWEGEFLEVEPSARIVFTITDEPGTPAGDPITVDFRDVEGGTEVVLAQPRRDFSDEQVAATIEGYNSFFDSFERILTAQRSA